MPAKRIVLRNATLITRAPGQTAPVALTPAWRDWVRKFVERRQAVLRELAEQGSTQGR